ETVQIASSPTPGRARSYRSAWRSLARQTAGYDSTAQIGRSSSVSRTGGWSSDDSSGGGAAGRTLELRGGGRRSGAEREAALGEGDSTITSLAITSAAMRVWLASSSHWRVCRRPST